MQESSAYFPRICTVALLDLLRSSAAKLAHLRLNCLIPFYYLYVFLYLPLRRLLDLNAAQSGPNSSSSMISSSRPKQSISWTFLNDAMALSAKEMPKNHTDKAATSSCFATGILKCN